MHKNLAKFGDDDEKMYESQQFEDSAMSVFNTLDMAMENMDGKVDETVGCLRRAGRMHVKIKDFETIYFKVWSSVGLCFFEDKEPKIASYGMYQIPKEILKKGMCV